MEHVYSESRCEDDSDKDVRDVQYREGLVAIGEEFEDRLDEEEPVERHVDSDGVLGFVHHAEQDHVKRDQKHEKSMKRRLLTNPPHLPQKRRIIPRLQRLLPRLIRQKPIHKMRDPPNRLQLIMLVHLHTQLLLPLFRVEEELVLLVD